MTSCWSEGGEKVLTLQILFINLSPSALLSAYSVCSISSLSTHSNLQGGCYINSHFTDEKVETHLATCHLYTHFFIHEPLMYQEIRIPRRIR